MQSYSAVCLLQLPHTISLYTHSQYMQLYVYMQLTLLTPPPFAPPPYTHTRSPPPHTPSLLPPPHTLSPPPTLQVRAQEEFAALRRRAGWVAREVGAFWNKAERVVNYKVRLLLMLFWGGGGAGSACLCFGEGGLWNKAERVVNYKVRLLRSPAAAHGFVLFAEGVCGCSMSACCRPLCPPSPNPSTLHRFMLRLKAASVRCWTNTWT